MSDGQKDKLLMRFKDIILLIGGIGGLVLGLGKWFVLADTVERNQKKLEDIAPKIEVYGTRIAINDERWIQIQEDLKFIKRQLARNGRSE